MIWWVLLAIVVQALAAVALARWLRGPMRCHLCQQVVRVPMLEHFESECRAPRALQRAKVVRDLYRRGARR